MTSIDDRILARLLRLVHDLKDRVLTADSLSGLFDAAFTALYDCVPFDVAVAVDLQQDVDLYIATRSSAASFADERLVEAVRRSMSRVGSSARTGSEILVRAERHDLPAAEGDRNGLAQEIASPLRQGGKPAGFLFIARHEPFSAEERRVLDVFAAHVELIREHLGIRQKIGALEAVDPLTGIPNQRFFRQQLAHEIERARVYDVPLSILMIDVDDFQEVRTTFGPVVGDVVLSEVCGAIRDTLRTPDTLCKYGPAEFAVILPHTEGANACVVAERILARLQALQIDAGESHAICCSASIGVAQLDRADAAQGDVVRRADERLFAARRQGKNRYLF